jgi:hypothetical protein
MVARHAACACACHGVAVRRISGNIGNMRKYGLDENGRPALIDLPETGMGFQIVEASIWGTLKPLIVFNASEAIDLSEIGLEISSDPSAVLRNGLRIVDALRDVAVVTTMIMAPSPSIFTLTNSRMPMVNATFAAITAPLVALPSSLVKHVTLTATRKFHRFSAYAPDRRVDPVTGSFVAGTYATTESEISFVPTGFAAVGRFALPVNLPASNHYEIDAPAGTSVDFGTVAPAFGQAGGGVEAYFSSAVTNAAVPPAKHKPRPDE